MCVLGSTNFQFIFEFFSSKILSKVLYLNMNKKQKVYFGLFYLCTVDPPIFLNTVETISYLIYLYTVLETKAVQTFCKDYVEVEMCKN